MARSQTLRIRDIVLAAKDLDFKLVVGAPVVEPSEMRRVVPPIKPDQPLPSMTFYIGAALWKDFLFSYERYEDVTAALAGIEVQHYVRPTQENNNGERKGE